MVRVRHVSIQRFRGIKELVWHPGDGLNCVVGPGDSGKTTLLDALDLAMGMRRPSFTDADFHGLDTGKPVVVDVTLGDLPSELRSLEAYDWYFRAYSATSRVIEDEPRSGWETVLTLRMTVDQSLDADWSLYSKRATDAGLSGHLKGDHRRLIAPLRIGAVSEHHLAWRPGSVFSRLGTVDAELGDALAAAARVARESFGDQATKAVESALKEVNAAARDLNIPVGATARALLDPAAVTIGGGAVALHDEAGTPLRALGLGSARLLLAGLQRRATKGSGCTIVDEVEHGLEPHRVIQFLQALGSADATPSHQGFLSSHSPVAIRELQCSQLWVLRATGGKHHLIPVGKEMQGMVRSHPEALLSRRVLVCEGATEVGLVRGLDAVRAGQGKPGLYAMGVSPVDAIGESKVYAKARAFQALHYPVLVVRDDDVAPNTADEAAVHTAGGQTATWAVKQAFEDAVMDGAPAGQLGAVLDLAAAFHSEAKVDAHLTSASNGKLDIKAARAQIATGKPSKELRGILAKAANSGEWFKRIDRSEELTRSVIAPSLLQWAKPFRETIGKVLAWVDA